MVSLHSGTFYTIYFIIFWYSTGVKNCQNLQRGWWIWKNGRKSKKLILELEWNLDYKSNCTVASSSFVIDIHSITLYSCHERLRLVCTRQDSRYVVYYHNLSDTMNVARSVSKNKWSHLYSSVNTERYTLCAPYLHKARNKFFCSKNSM